MPVSEVDVIEVARRYVIENFDCRGLELFSLDGGGDFAKSLLTDKFDLNVATYTEEFWVILCESELEAHLRVEYLSMELIDQLT